MGHKALNLNLSYKLLLQLVKSYYQSQVEYGNYLYLKFYHIFQVYEALKQKIYLHAQIQTVDFYQKLSFEKDGEIFEEAGIKHYKMTFTP